MPGRTPREAVDAFLDPLREAIRCLSGAGFQVSPGGMGVVGNTHSWALNWGRSLTLSDDFAFAAQMHYEILDQGQSQGAERFRVSTRGYMYAVQARDGQELISAHWHPEGVSHHEEPHWHAGAAALSPTGVFLKRAPMPSPRISFEHMVRWILENLNITPALTDWQQRLARTEAIFEQHKSW